jgi:RIO kinase 1
VRHGQEIVAAKVYKERLTRSFKNDAAYREGRQVRNSRTQRAMDKGSRFGQQAAEEAWKAKEADALHALHAAGVRVPRPVVFYEGVLLMELVLDPFGHPAPRLIDAHVTHEHAAPLYEDLRSQVVKMLCCDLIHGDLSPYNVLAGRDGPVVIDFPQVIGAAHNSQSERFFQRDLDNLRRFFEPIDPSLRARAGDAREIWRAYARRELTPDFVPTGRHVEPVRHGRPDQGRPSHGDRPWADRPGGERPRGDRPRGDRPPGDRPHGNRPPGDRPPGDRPHGNRPPGDRPRGDRSHGDRPRGERPPGDRPPGDRPRGERPPGDRPRGERPPVDRPPHGQRPDHQDRRDRREQRGPQDQRERSDRRDQRERSGPPRPPVGPGHASPQPEIVRVNRLPPRPGSVPGQGQGHGQGQGQGGQRPGGQGRQPGDDQAKRRGHRRGPRH